jgi:hypothetical protein
MSQTERTFSGNGCLNFEEFTSKYTMESFLGKGSQGFVVSVSEERTGKRYAAKMVCEGKEPPKEFSVAKRITQYRDILENVTTLHDCAILDVEKFRALWKRKPPKGGVKDLGRQTNKPYWCETSYFVLITDEVMTTMERLLGENRVATGTSFGIPQYKVRRPTSAIKGYHLFELYYTVLRLIEIGVAPIDINPTNVGFAEAEGETYTICNCVLELPVGLHVRLIDYGYYTLKNPQDLQGIANKEVSLFLKGLLFQKILTPELDFTKEALGIWNLIMSGGILPAVQVLLRVAKVLGCKSSKKGPEPSMWDPCEVEIVGIRQVLKFIPVSKKAQDVIKNFLI